jgi:hypothetical protein
MLIAVASVVTKQAPTKRVSFKMNDMVRLPRFRLDTFCNPLIYTFANGRAPTIMTLSKALADKQIVSSVAVYPFARTRFCYPFATCQLTN